MWRRSSTLGEREGHAGRLAGLAAFLVTIALIVLLNVARADAAAPQAAGLALPVFADFAPDDEAEEEEDFGEEAEECGEEEVECVDEAEAAEETEGLSPPRECRLTGTSATVGANPHGRRVVLTIRYTARVATRVEISYRLRGTRGGLKMDSDRARFAGSGSFRDARTVTPAQMTRVLAARSFTIEIRPLGAPAYCHTYFDHRLAVRRATAHGPVWAD